jgi:hypothetical protein
MELMEGRKMKPTCEGCGKSGHGVEFNIFGPFEFGKYCVPCEKNMKLKDALKDIVAYSTPIPESESNYVPRREIKAASDLLDELAKEDE